MNGTRQQVCSLPDFCTLGQQIPDSMLNNVNQIREIIIFVIPTVKPFQYALAKQAF